MARTIALVHSPLLSPYSWDPVARALRAEGHRVVVPDLRPALTGPPPYQGRLRDAAVAGAEHPTTLVAHSAAGPLLPAIAEALGPAAAATIFVDARLPHPGLSWLESLDEERAARLSELAADGELPPWDTWFPAEALAGEIPDDEVRERFSADLRPTPLALCAEKALSPTPVFDGLPHAYVRLTPAYDGDADTAERAGWHVVRRNSVHLSPLTRADEVVNALHEIFAAG